MRDLPVLRTPSPLALAVLLGLAACGGDSKHASPSDTGDDTNDTGESDGANLDAGHTGRDAGSLDASKAHASDAATNDAQTPPVHGSDGGLDASVADASVADAGGGGFVLTPFPTSGTPITATDKKWTYIEFPDSQCRDGSKAGIAVSMNSASKKLMIFLEGGGACFDGQTCLINPANTALMQGEKTAGVFDRSNAQNPVKDWNFVYVPYCTGDTHGGANTNVTVNGVAGMQQFVGYLNMQKFLNRVVPTFKDATDVLLTGISAGGFGAAQNAVLVQRAFSNLKVRVVDDSGPPLSSKAIPTCLQDLYVKYWGFDKTILVDCGDECPNHHDFAQDYGLFLARNFSDRPSGLIESAQDGTISSFFGIGSNNCTGILGLTPVAGTLFQSELLAYRDKVKQYPAFGTYFPMGTQHTWLSDPSMYTGMAGGTKLVDWFTKIVNNQNAGNAGP